MAEEKKFSSKKPAPSSSGWFSGGSDERAMEVLFFFLILVAVFGSVSQFLSTHTLTSTLLPKSSGPNSFADVKTPIGKPVSLGGPTDVFSSPGGPSIGSQPADAKGVVTAGPEYINGERYWYVDFISGPDGWVPERILRNGSGGAFDPGDTPVGSSVKTKGDTSVLGSPGGPSVGSQPSGAKGTVTKGPLYANGQRYWFVDFESGPDGWVSEESLLNGNGGNFNPGSTAVGSRIKAVQNPTRVYDAAGGSSVGTQRAGAEGTITAGPVYKNGVRYWYVDFESGPDGWLAEADMQIVKSENVISKTIRIIGNFFKILSIILSLLFLSGIIYSVIRSSQIAAEEHKKEKEGEKKAAQGGTASHTDHLNRRWDRVITHVQSENPSDWRLSILEADIILSELLDRMGYSGENVGEKLQRIEKSDFNTLDDAWEAHKVRNLIAHQGSDYVLSQREAQRVVSLYANTFREFKYL